MKRKLIAWFVAGCVALALGLGFTTTAQTAQSPLPAIIADPGNGSGGGG
jgi:hypothetical protein